MQRPTQALRKEVAQCAEAYASTQEGGSTVERPTQALRKEVAQWRGLRKHPGRR